MILLVEIPDDVLEAAELEAELPDLELEAELPPEPAPEVQAADCARLAAARREHAALELLLTLGILALGMELFS